MKIKFTKNQLLITLGIVLLIGILISIYLVSKKYDDVNIISVNKEYNLVFNNKNDTLNIPVYFDRNDSFLTEIDEIDNVKIKNDNIELIGRLLEVKKVSTIKYDNKKYYEYSFSLSFSSYDNYKEPVFMSDGILYIRYSNGDELNLKIGNLNVFFNTTSDYYLNDLIVTKLEAVTNEVKSINTIVGLNFRIYNNTDKDISINTIKTKNKYYELDDSKVLYELLDNKENLKNKYNDYSYEAISTTDLDESISIKSKQYIDLFIPLKYLNGVKYLDRLPVYIDYTISGINHTFIQDDFKFLSNNSLILSSNGINKYVYKY